MTPAQKLVLYRGIALIKASGLGYAVRLPDGTVLGDLALAPERRTRVRGPNVNNFVRDTDYMTKMDAVTDSTPLFFPMESRERAVALQGTVCGYASKVWGKDTYLTTVTDSTLEVLRIEFPDELPATA